MQYRIRRALPQEWEAADRVAEAAFRDYEQAHTHWFRSLRDARHMRELGQGAELLVAVADTGIVGTVGYMPPGTPRYEFFPREWAILRMLSVPREHRGHGIGRALAEACIECARRDAAPVLGLYTSPIMMVAVPMYQRMGFEHQRSLPAEDGVPCDLYALRLT